MLKGKKLLILCPYPLGRVGSQRFRFELYMSHLQQLGYRIDHQPFWSTHYFEYLYKKGISCLYGQIIGLLIGIYRRYILLFRLRMYSHILIHRETIPVGAPVYGWLVSKLRKGELIYDFDDAIWLTDATVSYMKRLLRCPSKTSHLCNWADRVLCGNEFLTQYAKQHHHRAFCLPTVVDTETMHHPRLYRISKKHVPLTIGWTGSHSTLGYLDGLWHILEQLREDICFRFLVIANQAPRVNYDWVVFQNWRSSHEVEDLLAIDIGLMPLEEDAWARGKCGFKLIQYLSLEIPALASDVGVNSSILIDGESGYLCRTDKEWLNSLRKLCEDAKLRARMGAAGRAHICAHYSAAAHKESFVSHLEQHNFL